MASEDGRGREQGNTKEGDYGVDKPIEGEMALKKKLRS